MEDDFPEAVGPGQLQAPRFDQIVEKFGMMDHQGLQAELAVVVFQSRITVRAVGQDLLDVILFEKLDILLGHFFEDELVSQPAQGIAAAEFFRPQDPEGNPGRLAGPLRRPGSPFCCGRRKPRRSRHRTDIPPACPAERTGISRSLAHLARSPGMIPQGLDRCSMASKKTRSSAGNLARFCTRWRRILRILGTCSMKTGQLAMQAPQVVQAQMASSPTVPGFVIRLPDEGLERLRPPVRERSLFPVVEEVVLCRPGSR